MERPEIFVAEAQVKTQFGTELPGISSEEIKRVNRHKALRIANRDCRTAVGLGRDAGRYRATGYVASQKVGQSSCRRIHGWVIGPRTKGSVKDELTCPASVIKFFYEAFTNRTTISPFG